MPHLWLFMLYVWLTKDSYRFFASAWINKPAYTLEPPPGLLGEYSKILDEVSPDLPAQLQAKLDDVRQELPRLFRSSYPMVLQHDDLLENNIHVDEATGHITGKCPCGIFLFLSLWCSLE
jgi:Ser/Thr protein kinase RdoA (MazF antagonist)